MHAQNTGINTPALACQSPKILQALARKSLTCFVGPNAIQLVLLQLLCSACSLQGCDLNNLFFLQCLTLILVELTQATRHISVAYADCLSLLNIYQRRTAIQNDSSRGSQFPVTVQEETQIHSLGIPSVKH